MTTLPPNVALAYAEARVNPRTLGIDVDHHQAADGTWRATVDLEDLLALVAVALTPTDPSAVARRPAR